MVTSSSKLNWELGPIKLTKGSFQQQPTSCIISYQPFKNNPSIHLHFPEWKPFQTCNCQWLEKVISEKNSQVIGKLCSTSFHKEEGHGIWQQNKSPDLTCTTLIFSKDGRLFLVLATTNYFSNKKLGNF